MENNYYLYGKKAKSASGYGKTRITGEFAIRIDEALRDKSAIRAKTLFSTEKADYQILSVDKFGTYQDITFIRLSK